MRVSKAPVKLAASEGVLCFRQIALPEFACETRKHFDISDFRSRNGSLSLRQRSDQEQRPPKLWGYTLEGYFKSRLH